MLPSDQFIAGLVSFLIAHLFYIFAFTTGRRIKLSLTGLPFLLYGTMIYMILFPYLEAMTLPVLVYVAVILIMGWQAFEQWNLSKNTFTCLAFVGAVLFIFSDSVLALNKFRESFEIARALNLSTYFIAQWMIALSVLRRKQRFYNRCPLYSYQPVYPITIGKDKTQDITRKFLTRFKSNESLYF